MKEGLKTWHLAVPASDPCPAHPGWDSPLWVVLVWQSILPGLYELKRTLLQLSHVALWGLPVSCWLKKLFQTGFQMALLWCKTLAHYTSTFHCPPSWKEQWPLGLESKEKKVQSRDILKIPLNWKMKLFLFHILAYRQKRKFKCRLGN